MDEYIKNESENANAQMRKGILEYCILLAISQTDKSYASDILKILKTANLIVVEGTIYPLLNRLKNSGLLEYFWEESKGGPPRKYFSLTDKGKSYLKSLENNWNQISQSINSLKNNS